MSVLGIGTDIVEVARIEQMAEKARQRLAERVLTKEELDRYSAHRQPVSYLAKRWAAKEAASKAIGFGIANGLSFQHFQIDSRENGAPVLILADRALELAQQMGANSWHISLSDEKHYALAMVVLSS